MSARPALEDIRLAAAGLADVVVRTPLLPFRSARGDLGIVLKPETLQPVSSFKLRGVFWAVTSMHEDERRAGISTVSAGNTAQALAWAGRHFGVEARAIMPETAPRTKVDAVRALGGTPVLVPRDEVFRYMREELWRRDPYAYVCPWTNPRVHAGHGTLGLEIAEDVTGLDTVYVPVGGGGLLCGVGSAIKAVSPKPRIVAVEPDGCPAFFQSLQAGRPEHVACATMCDGVAVPYMTEEMFPVLRDLVDDAVLVSEEQVRAAIRALAFENKLVAEGAGALSLAAALATPPEERGTTACIVTGGNIDPAALASALEPG